MPSYCYDGTVATCIPFLLYFICLLSLSLTLSLSTKVTFLSFKVAAEAGLDSEWSGRGEIGVGTTDSDGLSLRLPCLSLSLSNCLSVSHISLSVTGGSLRHRWPSYCPATPSPGHHWPPSRPAMIVRSLRHGFAVRSLQRL